MGDNKLYDVEGNDFDGSINAVKIIFTYPIIYLIFLFIGSLFGIVGTSIVLWFFVIYNIGIVLDTPFQAKGRLLATLYLALIFWLISGITLNFNYGSVAQANWGFWIILIFGSYFSVTDKPKGMLIDYKPTKIRPHPDSMNNQMHRTANQQFREYDPKSNPKYEKTMKKLDTNAQWYQEWVERKMRRENPEITSTTTQEELEKIMEREVQDLEDTINAGNMFIQNMNEAVLEFVDEFKKETTETDELNKEIAEIVKPRFCSNCGTKSSSKFCTSCGKIIK